MQKLIRDQETKMKRVIELTKMIRPSAIDSITQKDLQNAIAELGSLSRSKDPKVARVATTAQQDLLSQYGIAYEEILDKLQT